MNGGCCTIWFSKCALSTSKSSRKCSVKASMQWTRHCSCDCCAPIGWISMWHVGWCTQGIWHKKGPYRKDRFALSSWGRLTPGQNILRLYYWGSLCWFQTEGSCCFYGVSGTPWHATAQSICFWVLVFSASCSNIMGNICASGFLPHGANVPGTRRRLGSFGLGAIQIVAHLCNIAMCCTPQRLGDLNL